MSRAPTEKQLTALIATYSEKMDEFDLFRQQVAAFFSSRPFTSGRLPLVHSVKSRLKDPDHLREKLLRKAREAPVRPGELFTRVTDFSGVRVLHLYSQQFPDLHRLITKHINEGHWVLNEEPVGYSWDPEATAMLTGLGIACQTKESYYTSIHYVVRPFQGSFLSCEIQVRTLFEEAWGEIDHAINYPSPTAVVSCKEQLRVLAKLASTGTRLADSIFRSHDQ